MWALTVAFLSPFPLKYNHWIWGNTCSNNTNIPIFPILEPQILDVSWTINNQLGIVSQWSWTCFYDSYFCKIYDPHTLRQKCFITKAHFKKNLGYWPLIKVKLDNSSSVYKTFILWFLSNTIGKPLSSYGLGWLNPSLFSSDLCTEFQGSEQKYGT